MAASGSLTPPDPTREYDAVIRRRLDFYVNRKWRMEHPWVDAVRNGGLT